MSAPFPVCTRGIAQPKHDSSGLNLRLRSSDVEVEFSAAAGGVPEADLAAEPHDDLLDDAQPEAGAALLAALGGIGLRELLENAAA